MNRVPGDEARSIIAEELARELWEAISSFTLGDGPHPGTAILGWWHQNTPANEASDTKRSIAYLRAYLRIGGARLYAGGHFSAMKAVDGSFSHQST